MTTPAPTPTPSPRALDYLRQLVHAGSAIVLDVGKNYLFQARLAPFLVDEGVADFDELVNRADRDPALSQRIVEAMTTNETSFFRDIHPFEALRNVVLPELATARRDHKSLNIWSAGCSTGQELNSIAFLVKELGDRFPGLSTRLMGTDLSTGALARARAGRYSQIEVNRGLPAPLLLRYFTRVGTEWQLVDEIREMTEFKRMNLIEPWPAMPPFDLVFLRNVLIYFDAISRRRILDRVSALIRPGGYLFLGGVETTMNLAGTLRIVQIEKTMCYRAASEGEKNATVVSA